MKVKILSCSDNKFWYSNNIGMEYEVDYVINNNTNRYHHPVDNRTTRLINTHEGVITEPPESFCVKLCDQPEEEDEDQWDDDMSWMDED